MVSTSLYRRPRLCSWGPKVDSATSALQRGPSTFTGWPCSTCLLGVKGFPCPARSTTCFGVMFVCVGVWVRQLDGSLIKIKQFSSISLLNQPKGSPQKKTCADCRRCSVLRPTFPFPLRGWFPFGFALEPSKDASDHPANDQHLDEQVGQNGKVSQVRMSVSCRVAHGRNSQTSSHQAGVVLGHECWQVEHRQERQTWLGPASRFTQLDPEESLSTRTQDLKKRQHSSIFTVQSRGMT